MTPRKVLKRGDRVKFVRVTLEDSAEDPPIGALGKVIEVGPESLTISLDEFVVSEHGRRCDYAVNRDELRKCPTRKATGEVLREG